MGGPMNVDETDRYPFLGPEIGWIRQAVEMGLPTLGICLGAACRQSARGQGISDGEGRERTDP